MRILILLVSLSIYSLYASAQAIGIGTTNPHQSAALDISSISGGLLIPRMSLEQRNAIPTPAKGLIVFIVTDSSLYYFDGIWKRLVPAGESWSINGNNLQNSDSSFIGTTNATSLRFKVNNQNSGLIDSAGANTALGYKSLLSNTTGFGNIAFGTSALKDNTSGYSNVAIGLSALLRNTVGIRNTAVGDLSLALNITGLQNVSIGYEAMYNNKSGFNNTAVGGSALWHNSGPDGTSGNFNTAIGSGALGWNTIGSNNTAVGVGALFYNAHGNYNTAIGSNATANVNAVVSNATAIGANSWIDESNKIRLGDQNVTKVETSGVVIAAGFSSGLTTTEIQALVLPREGTIIYNSTAKKPVYFDGTIWKYFNETAM